MDKLTLKIQIKHQSDIRVWRSLESCKVPTKKPGNIPLMRPTFLKMQHLDYNCKHVELMDEFYNMP